MRKKLIQVLTACLLVAVSARAGTNIFRFNADPAADLTIVRNEEANAAGLAGVWFPTSGSTLEVGTDPSTNGYLQLTAGNPSPPAAFGHRAVIVFDDFDAGLVVAGFTFSCDVRVGAGTDNPADGFSLNYASASDPVVTGGTGGPWSTNPGNENPAVLVEEGTQTGLAIAFDAWNSGSGDVIGITVKVDAGTAAGGGVVTNIALATLNGVCADATSMQTGPNGLGVAGLCWQPLFAQLTTDGKLSVSYKGVAFLTNYPVVFAPRPGRLVFGGRVGGANQFQHVDNIRLVTVPSAKPVVSTTVGNANGFKFSISDSGGATPSTNTIVVTLDGNPVTPSSMTQSGNVGGGNGVTSVSYQNTALVLAPGSTHSNVITFTGTTFSGSVTVTNVFTVPAYTFLAAADQAPSAVNVSLGGLAARVHQLPVPRYPSATSLIGVERHLADGFIDPGTSLPYASITFSNNWTGDVLNWEQNASLGGDDVGIFQDDSVAPADWGDEQIPGVDTLNTDNIAAELLTILDLPVGAYELGVNHDDGFKLTAGAEPRDVFKARLLSSAGNAVDNAGIHIVVTNAGKYPVRLAWGEGGGGAHLEFYLVDFNTGQKILINNRTNPVQITSYRDTAALTQPYVRWTFPAATETGVNPDAPIIVKFEDGTAATVADGSIQILLNGSPLTASIANAGTLTTATAGHGTLSSGSTNTVTLVYSTSAGGPFTNTWQYIATPYISLPTNLRTATGTGDATKPGFVVKSWQLMQGVANFQNENDVANMMLLGLNGTNAADLSAFTGGVYNETGVVNWRGNVGSGNDEGSFTSANGFADVLVPGLPGAGVNGTENISAEAVTYVEFPTTGFYSMGVQSDDGFRLTLGDTAGPRVANLSVTTPGPLARRYGAIQTIQPRDAFGGPLPVAPITRRLVIPNPLLAGSALVNAADMAGNIALIPRGVAGFAVKAKNAQDAGAVAVVIWNATGTNATNGDALPQRMGGTDTNVIIPCFMISYADGAILSASATTTSNSPVTMSISRGDDRLILGEFNGGRGADTPTFIGMYVAQAGVYPMRLVWENAGGGVSVEWWSQDPTGGRHLINNTSDPMALKAYRARTGVGAVPVLHPPVLSGGNVTLSWTGVGELQEAGLVTGPYSTIINQANPSTLSATNGQSYYRIRQY